MRVVQQQPRKRLSGKIAINGNRRVAPVRSALAQQYDDQRANKLAKPDRAHPTYHAGDYAAAAPTLETQSATRTSN